MELTPSLLATLQKLRLFQDLSPTQIKRVFGACKQESFDVDALLCRVGAESDRMFIVLAGAVEIRSGKDLLLGRERAVTTIGETGLLSAEVRAASVKVSEPVTALVIGRRPLQLLMQDDAALAIRLYRNAMVLVRQKLIAADERLERLLQGKESDD